MSAQLVAEPSGFSFMVAVAIPPVVHVVWYATGMHIASPAGTVRGAVRVGLQASRNG